MKLALRQLDRASARTQPTTFGKAQRRGRYLGYNSVKIRRTPQSGPPLGDSSQARTPPPMLTSWLPSLVTLVYERFTGTVHCLASQS